MHNGWTYGQFSLFRILLGGFLVVHFSHLIPYAMEIFSNQGALSVASNSPLIYLFPNLLAWFDSPTMLVILLGLGIISGCGIMLGKYDKLSAFYAFYLLACLISRNPLITNPSLPYLGWMLVLYLFIPGRKNSESWRLSQSLYFAAWAILALTYTYSGYTKLLSPSWVSGETIDFVLQNPLARDLWFREWLLSLPTIYLKSLTWGILWVELLFVPLAMSKRLRPLAWLVMLIVQGGFLICLNFADLTFPMLLIHLLTFDPNWIKPREHKLPLWLFYDGQCGLCHRYVKLVLSEDKRECINFSPLQGNSFKNKYSHKLGNQLNSMYLLLPDGTLQSRSDAVITIFQTLGGLNAIYGFLLLCIPKAMRNFGYDLNAKLRSFYFKKPDALCPVIPAYHQHRFELI